MMIEIKILTAIETVTEIMIMIKTDTKKTETEIVIMIMKIEAEVKIIDKIMIIINEDLELTTMFV